MIWGPGYLSPGGPDEVARLLEGLDLSNKAVLDIGCGSGGITVSLAKDYGAKSVVGIDVEATVCDTARRRVIEADLNEHIDIRQVNPGPFEFDDDHFDFVFSKDSIIHIPNKETLANEAFRILKPSGWFVASDWLISHDNKPSAQMARYIELEGLDFAMASPQRYQNALKGAGFCNVSLRNRNNWYHQQAISELKELQGPRKSEFEDIVGAQHLSENIEIWRAMLNVLETGEHCPHHFRGQKPE